MRKLFVIFIKIVKRLKSLIKKFGWKVAYLSGFKCGINTFFYPGCRVMVEEKGSFRVGNGCFFNHNCSITCLGNIQIGNHCIFGENVKMYDHNHEFKQQDVKFKDQGYSIGYIKIGDNCWIGSNVTILANVEIGNNVVIGAGTIVTKSIPDNTVVYGKTNNVYRA